MTQTTTLEKNALAGDTAALSSLIERLHQAESLLDDTCDALRGFIEYNAEAEGDVALVDCDRLWENGEVVLTRAKQHQNIT